MSHNKVLLVECLMVAPGTAGDLKESMSGPRYTIVEGTGSNKLIVRVPATTLDVKNENGRVYSTQVMETALKRAEADIKAKKLLCTVDDHPEETFVPPGNASHIVTRAWVENGYLMNEWQILETSKGKDLKALIDAEASFGVSIRGLGSMDNYGNILEDYEYFGTDCVGQPSARIWANPKPVTDEPSRSTTKESITKEPTVMKSHLDVEKYLKEQVTLLRNDTPADAYRRAAVVESELAASVAGWSPKQVTSIFSAWEKDKNAVLEASVKTPDGMTLEQAVARIKTLEARNVTVSRIYREQLLKINAKHQSEKKVLTAGLKRASESRKVLGKKVQRLEGSLRKVVTERTNLKKLYLTSVRERSVVATKYGIAVEVAAKSTKIARKVLEKATKYDIAVQEAAKLSKQVKKLESGLASVQVASTSQFVRNESFGTDQGPNVRNVVRTSTTVKEGVAKKGKPMSGYDTREHSLPGYI